MPTNCTASGSISAGDAVCLVRFDAATYPLRPVLVARATAANLLTSETLHGVARANATTGNLVVVNVSGDAFEATLFPMGSPMLSGTGAGSSHVVATDITQASAVDQCKLIRVERPNGSEHILATCDENGNLAVQPRASKDTSA